MIKSTALKNNATATDARMKQVTRDFAKLNTSTGTETSAVTDNGEGTQWTTDLQGANQRKPVDGYLAQRHMIRTRPRDPFSHGVAMAFAAAWEQISSDDNDRPTTMQKIHSDDHVACVQRMADERRVMNQQPRSASHGNTAPRCNHKACGKANVEQVPGEDIDDEEGHICINP